MSRGRATADVLAAIAAGAAAGVLLELGAELLRATARGVQRELDAYAAMRAVPVIERAAQLVDEANEDADDYARLAGQWRQDAIGWNRRAGELADEVLQLRARSDMQGATIREQRDRNANQQSTIRYLQGKLEDALNRPAPIALLTAGDTPAPAIVDGDPID